MNTAIDLLRDGAVLATNVNRDAAAHDFCSEITRHLEPGLYHLRVTSSTSGPPRSFERQSVGYYRISARPVN